MIREALGNADIRDGIERVIPVLHALLTTEQTPQQDISINLTEPVCTWKVRMLKLAKTQSEPLEEDELPSIAYAALPDTVVTPSPTLSEPRRAVDMGSFN